MPAVIPPHKRHATRGLRLTVHGRRRSLSANPLSWPHQLPDCGTLNWLAAGDDDPGEGAAHGSPRRGTWVFSVSTETSVPEAAGYGRLRSGGRRWSHQAPVGLAFLGPDLRFRRVNAALAADDREARGRPRRQAPVRGLAGGAGDPGRGRAAQGAGRRPPGHRVRAIPQGRTARPGSPCPTRTAQIAGVGLVLSEAAGAAAEEEIRRSEERYRSLVQGGAQVVWVAGPDGAMHGGLARMAVDHRAVRRGLHRLRLAGLDPPRGPGAGRARLARVRPDRQGLRRPLPDPHQGRARTGITTCARCRSSGTARSSSGSAPAPTSPASARPRRCAGG